MIFWNTPISQLVKTTILVLLLGWAVSWRVPVAQAVVCPDNDLNCCIGSPVCDDPSYYYYAPYSTPASNTCRKTEPVSNHSFPSGSNPAAVTQIGALTCSSGCFSIFVRESTNSSSPDPDFYVSCYPELGGVCSYPQNCGADQSGKQVCSGEYGEVNGVVGCQATECTPCAYCGNGVCEVGEGIDNCPADCSQPTATECGDGYCSPSEYTQFSPCRSDCDPIVKAGQCRYTQQCPDRANQYQVCTGTTGDTADCRYNADVVPNCSPCSTSGNQRCEPGERARNSPDCQNPLPPVCGNGICEEGEELQCRDCTRFAGVGPGDVSGDGSGISCGWEVRSENGFRLCFSSNDRNNLAQGRVRFICENIGNVNDCGGVVMQLIYSLNPPTIQLGDNITLNPYTGQETGRYYACFDGNFDTNQILSVARANITRRCAQQLTIDITQFLLISRIVPTAGAGGMVGRLINAPRTIAQVATLFQATGDVMGIVGAGAPACLTDAIDASFGYRASFSKGGLSCDTRLQFQYSSPELPEVIEPGEDYDRSGGDSSGDGAELGQPISPFGYCQQVPEGSQRTACEACLQRGGATISSSNNLDPKDTIYTAVGCLNITQSGLAADLIRLILGIAGGLALLFILVAAFTFSTSRGDSNKIKSAREQITAAVAGLFFIIFSIIVLNFIGVQILRIPGLG